ncbi:MULTISPECIES: helix-turn-helix transcriptional regulator [unclassified Desulfovibrio]|uniref:XRE family transcriptional regulator n=1 Tax=unclassified Desulfovibrio TaxID=2593640 RepID=UPI000F5E13FB|nr:MULTISPECIES: helix-turn-helix transcriptional regulator [unclassified Desulfovibrio]RRD69219.1 helix-turn-helix transcriptional regulator [Desulfovibrio sp. OH1209_COT-279]RRD85694.1 helix-turn-helix transcriptional regulator [Desulfovibrio sp. OH1186_COT-070]
MPGEKCSPERAFARRLRQRREELGLRKQEIARRAGLSLTTIQQYENGQLPKSLHALALAEILNCSLDWLLAGRGDAGDGLYDTPETRLVMVPLAEARLSAGTGSLETGGDVLRHYAFRWDFLRRKGNPGQMVLLRVSGDSMQPRILHNDVVLIDQSRRDPEPGRIYAVGVEDMVYLKVVNAVPGRLVLSSINPDYPPIEAPAGEQMDTAVRIIGKAVWVGRELE